MSLRDLARGGKGGGRPYRRFLTAKEVRRMRKRGYDAEREIVGRLREAGFMAVRIPVSAPSNEPLPDVFAVKGDRILAIEVKSQGRYAYFKKKQVEKLFQFLEIHRIYSKRMAVLAAKFKWAGWSLIIADEPRDYSIKRGEGLSFEEFLRKCLE
ncbi:endonuclease [Candidatus Bathyarchaeota archaeon]|nr:MAG: endonuclease [Candidatus Bathyarchaeota archaeon]RLI31956.1 MAG: endonuclease [Candidatus Bathyarchaeota archaeon]